MKRLFNRMRQTRSNILIWMKSTSPVLKLEQELLKLLYSKSYPFFGTFWLSETFQIYKNWKIENFIADCIALSKIIQTAVITRFQIMIIMLNTHIPKGILVRCLNFSNENKKGPMRYYYLKLFCILTEMQILNYLFSRRAFLPTLELFLSSSMFWKLTMTQLSSIISTQAGHCFDIGCWK